MRKLRISDIKPLSERDSARYLANHLPSGRAWNKQDRESNIWRLIFSVSAGLRLLMTQAWKMFYNWRVETCDSEHLKRWEESFSIPVDLTRDTDDRRARVESYIKRKEVITVEDWESILITATGNTDIEVYPALNSSDSAWILPNPVPTPLYAISDENQKPFVVYVDNVADEDEKQVILDTCRKFQPANVFVICIITG